MRNSLPYLEGGGLTGARGTLVVSEPRWWLTANLSFWSSELDFARRVACSFLGAFTDFCGRTTSKFVSLQPELDRQGSKSSVCGPEVFTVESREPTTNE